MINRYQLLMTLFKMIPLLQKHEQDVQFIDGAWRCGIAGPLNDLVQWANATEVVFITAATKNKVCDIMGICEDTRYGAGGEVIIEHSLFFGDRKKGDDE